MWKYYRVTSVINRDGNVTAKLTATLNADEEPENTFAQTENEDIYEDWFPTLEQVKQFIRWAKELNAEATV